MGFGVPLGRRFQGSKVSSEAAVKATNMSKMRDDSVEFESVSLGSFPGLSAALVGSYVSAMHSGADPHIACIFFLLLRSESVVMQL